MTRQLYNCGLWQFSFSCVKYDILQPREWWLRNILSTNIFCNDWENILRRLRRWADNLWCRPFTDHLASIIRNNIIPPDIFRLLSDQSWLSILYGKPINRAYCRTLSPDGVLVYFPNNQNPTFLTFLTSSLPFSLSLQSHLSSFFLHSHLSPLLLSFYILF